MGDVDGHSEGSRPVIRAMFKFRCLGRYIGRRGLWLEFASGSYVRVRVT